MTWLTSNGHTAVHPGSEVRNENNDHIFYYD
jgi:hypothetical protein